MHEGPSAGAEAFSSREARAEVLRLKDGLLKRREDLLSAIEYTVRSSCCHGNISRETVRPKLLLVTSQCSATVGSLFPARRVTAVGKRCRGMEKQSDFLLMRRLRDLRSADIWSHRYNIFQCKFVGQSVQLPHVHFKVTGEKAHCSVRFAACCCAVWF